MASRIQLQESMTKPYDRLLFAKDVLNPVFGTCFTLYNQAITPEIQPNQTESDVLDRVQIYGSMKLEDGTEITCYEIALKPSVQIDRSRVAIQHYVRKLLMAGHIGLINFISPGSDRTWRFTLVAKDSKITDQGIKEHPTNPRRYTYLLGPSETCRTAAEQLEKLSVESRLTFDALKNAFSVEKLSKAFFDEYTRHYSAFCDYLQDSTFRRSVFSIPYPADATKQEKDKLSKPIRDFVKKLLGRIVFLYFVQKKGWMGASDTRYEDGLPDFIKQLFLQSGGDEGFYFNWLHKLFFDTLNRARPGDDFTLPDKKIVKVPFLNGGLFDQESCDEKLLTFPPKLFHHPDLEDDEKHRGFLDFLDAYNFTIYEDSHEDHTMAVDPEMLGHIFENLLEDNKDKGTFYTPKEIVHYMCQESLIEYLVTHLGKQYTLYKPIGDGQVELFGNDVREGQLKMVEELGEKSLDRDNVEGMVKRKEISNLNATHLRQINQLLDAVKICDPAIGSGAFPMGLLQEIFAIKELIAYETGTEWDPSTVKENIIQNSIYGVDIEKGAVDIARLRFWLSLVVNEESPKPLPNLDYKIVEGDSLLSKLRIAGEEEIVEIDWEKTHSVGNADTFIQKIKSLLLQITDRQRYYFHASVEEKKRLNEQIRALKTNLMINQLAFNKAHYLNSTQEKGGFAPTVRDLKYNEEREKTIGRFDSIITQLTKSKNQPEKPFHYFDWKLDFPEVLNPYLVNGKGGFDIVIGNPPYGAAFNSEEKKFLFQKYTIIKGQPESYEYFIFQCLHSITKDIGITALIVPTNFIESKRAEGLRETILSSGQIIVLSNFRFNVWKNNAAETLIFIHKKNSKGKTKVLHPKTITEFLNGVGVEKLNQEKWNNTVGKRFIIRADNNLLEMINLNCITLGSITDICQGIIVYKTREDGEKNLYIKPYKQEIGNWVKLLDTKSNIDPFKINWGGSFLNYGNWLWCPRDVKYFTNPKILFIRLRNKSLHRKLIGAYDESRFYNRDNFNNIIQKDKSYSLKFILSIFNSTVINYWYKSHFDNVNINPEQVRLIPIKKSNELIQKPFIYITDYIVFLKSNIHYNLNDKLKLTYLEQVLDGMVYELYFPELLKKHDREIIKHLGELPEITDDMADEKKLEIITTVFNRLNAKDHPVRVNLEQMDTIPEIRIIEGKDNNNN